MPQMIYGADLNIPIFGSVKDAYLDGEEGGDDDIRHEDQEDLVHGGFGENREGDLLRNGGGGKWVGEYYYYIS